MTTPSRQEVAISWDLTPLFPSFTAWKEAFETAKKSSDWHALRERPFESLKDLLDYLEHFYELSRQLEKLYTWAHLKHDEDLQQQEHKEAFAAALFLLNDFKVATAWFESALLTSSLPLNDPLLQPYAVCIQRILRKRPYTLSASEEKLIAMAEKAFQATSKAFSQCNDVDLVFEDVEDSKQESFPLSVSRYSLYMQHPDRILRQNAFESLYRGYSLHKNTLCELLSGQCLAHDFQAKAHGYQSALHASLFTHEIDLSVYHQLISTTHQQLPLLHRYLKLKKEALKLKHLHSFDLQAPLTSVRLKPSYEEGMQMVIDSVAPLGKSYQEILSKGLQQEKWVDPFENRFKRSGAYSSGCYDSSPFILMNYKESARDLFVLAHELGHSMHSYLSNHHQPYHLASYPIFLAEIASTFNEELLFWHWLDLLSSKEEKLFLIHSRLEDIRATFFRQVLFAEFELTLHEWAQKDRPFTVAKLSQEYSRLLSFYLGDAASLDPEIALEWCRIPHFYYNFYVYQYATGIAAALTFAAQFRKGVPGVQERYLQFLSSGNSEAPLNLLKKAGVDLTTPQYILDAMIHFERLLDEFEQILSS